MNDNLKELVRFTIIEFFIITVCVMFVISAVNTVVNGFYKIDASFPWAMLLTGLIGALPTFLFYFRGEPTKKQFYTRVVSHFLSIEAVILAEGYFLGWFTDIGELAVVAAMILAVYILVWSFTIISQKSTANNINKALQNFNQDEEV